MDEQFYEKLFNIRTSGDQKGFNESIHYHRYEPTSYTALEVLAEQYAFSAADDIVDFGCGKGRFSFYINHFFNSKVTGIEMSKFFYKQAIENQKSYSQTSRNKGDNLCFLNCLAEDYDVTESNNKFYFFNPFSMQIFSRVIKNILVSTGIHKRTVDIILYYPSKDYIYFLETNSLFQLVNEIKVPDMYSNDPGHRFLIYRAE